MPKQNPVVGIDLGTTFSAIAYVNPDTGRAEIIPSPEQERITPSVVLFEDKDNVIVGKLAKQNAVADADRWGVIRSGEIDRVFERSRDHARRWGHGRRSDP